MTGLQEVEKKKIIIDHLIWDDSVNADEIEVEVEGNLVKLMGYVENYVAKIAAERDALFVSGVDKVENYLNVRFPPGEPSPVDEDIRSNIRNILNWDSRIPSAENINVDVTRGVVTLTGSVDSFWEKSVAGEVCNAVTGVVEVDNKLDTRPRSQRKDEEIRNDIERAFDRSMLFREQRIDIEVKDGMVTLTGTVPSTAARNEAYNTALYTAGVKDVNGNITVG